MKKNGRKPYGVKPGQAEIVAKIKRYHNVHHGRRKSFCEIANQLNAQQVQPPAGKRWYGTTIRRIVERANITTAAKARKKTGLEGNDYIDIYQAADLFEAMMDEFDMGRRHRQRAAIVMLLMLTGLRNFELCSLQLRDMPYFHGKNSITVREGKGRKGGSIKISAACRGMIDEFIELTKPVWDRNKATEWVFRNESKASGRLSTGSIRGIVSGVGRRANLSFLRPHKLRHTYATILHFVTRDIYFVQSQLRHSSIAVTGLYLHVIDGKLGKSTSPKIRQLIKAIDPRQNETL